MKERPILFSAQMVRAILDGRKTQTRRIAKPIKHPDWGNEYSPGALITEKESNYVIERACPYGSKGERLWVRETFSHHPQFADIAYRADGEEFEDSDGFLWEPKWKPSIHMPRSASRILLEITGVRVERLQDISEEDAKSEGAQAINFGYGDCYALGFKQLWESINGPGSWDLNPWVWVIDFKRINEEQTGGNNNPEHRQESARKR